jgi:hypothetical protein
VGGRAEIFQLLASEDIDGDQVDLGVTVLSGLRGRHFDDLAGTVLDHDVAVLAQSRALHRVGGRGTSIGGAIELMILEDGTISIGRDGTGHAIPGGLSKALRAAQLGGKSRGGAASTGAKFPAGERRWGWTREGQVLQRQP